MVVPGLYGILAQLVSYRRRDIGIRMAVGATRGRVARMVLVKPTDLSTYAAVSILLLAIGLLASASIEPMQALREG